MEEIRDEMAMHHMVPILAFGQHFLMGSIGGPVRGLQLDNVPIPVLIEALERYLIDLRHEMLEGV